MMHLHLLVLLLAICDTTLGAAESAPSVPSPVAEEHFDHCIIGAGPGGVQLGFFLQQSKRSYIVLERAAQAAAFFAKCVSSRLSFRFLWFAGFAWSLPRL